MKCKAIALRAKQACATVCLHITLLVGSYFGSRIKSFNPKLGNRAEREAFVKSRISILFPQTTEPPAVAPPEPREDPSPAAAGPPPGPPRAAGPPPAQAPPSPPLPAPIEGGVGPPPRHSPQVSHCSTSTAQLLHTNPATLRQHLQPWRSSRRASAHSPVLTIPTAQAQTFTISCKTSTPSLSLDSQLALMQCMRHPQSHVFDDSHRKANRLSDPCQDIHDPSPGQ